MRREPEHIEAVALMRWVRLSTARYPDLAMLWHVPNGGHRSKATAGKMKAEGVKAGVSDYVLDCARGGYFGLRIELKPKGGRPSPAQKDYISDVTAQGYRAEVAVGWESAKDILIDYLEQPRTEVKA